MISILWNIITSTIHFCTVAPSICWQWTMLSLSYIHLLDHLVCNHCFHLCKHTNMPSYTNIRTYFLFIVSSHWYTKILVRYICSNLSEILIRWCISGASPLTAWHCPLPHCWGEETFFTFSRGIGHPFALQVVTLDSYSHPEYGAPAGKALAGLCFAVTIKQ